MNTEKLFDKERNLGSITMNNGSTIFFEIQHDPELYIFGNLDDMINEYEDDEVLS